MEFKTNVCLDIAPKYLSKQNLFVELCEKVFIALEKEVEELTVPKIKSLTIRISDDAEILPLNKTYRGKDKPTNVLSFVNDDPFAEHNEEQNYLGDIIISCETVEKEALEQQKEFASHLSHMFIHGVLHLLGYDHEENADAEEMESLEIKVMLALGFSNPYK